MQERKGRLVIFPPPASAAKGFQGRASAPEKSPRPQVYRETVVSLLEDLAPLGEGLASLMAIPERLYAVDVPGGHSFSSEEGRDICRVAGSLMRGFVMPASFSDFGIHIGSEGHSVFCTLVDRKRGVMVCAPVRSMYSERGSWDAFQDALADALSAAQSNRAEGIRFSFVVNKDGSMTTV